MINAHQTILGSYSGVGLPVDRRFFGRHYLSQRFAHFVMSDAGNPSGSVSATSASFGTMLTIRHLPVESTAKNVSEAESPALVPLILAIPK